MVYSTHTTSKTVALMTFTCGALAVLLIAFTVYSQVARQRRELAVAKALGASNRALAIQAGILAFSSVVLATILALILMPIVMDLIPMITLQLTTASVLRTAVVGIVVAVLASIVPAHRIARLDPMTAFQG